MAKTFQTATKRAKAAGILTCFLLYSQIASTQNLDIQLLNSWHRDRNTSLDATMNTIDYTVYPVSLIVPTAQLIHALAKHDAKSFEYGVQTVTTLAINTVVTYGLKYAIRRDRPYVDHPEYVPYEHDASPSFPSGHVSFAFATATNLSIEYPKWYVIAPSYLYAGVVGYSRIHLGAHYPSDVLAGAIIGAASAYVSYKGNQWLKHKWQKKTEKYFN